MKLGKHMKFKNTFITLTIIIFLSSLTACTSNQVEPTANVEKTSNTEVANSQTKSEETTADTKATELPQPTLVKPSRGPSQSAGARFSIYIVKVVVSAAVTYFVTKAIVDYVKDDLTGED